ncbi:hypothetical protein OIU34_00010 [Pararhizobium sp. BT-229]|uniref:DUF6538 domain-containing protein n=1 Tax=Pararhizobium sp. BT-229 TaxID=2986923 RepID=UPI0021F6ABAC|nr:DUF6538 domain-containing protein [Pararhizobium sp. BT-229]MCV9960271.1 hypothetical protein [Pararhizobium sp. BT-229]
MSLDYIVKRGNGNYSFRITVPKEHRHRPRFKGKTEIWETLKTKDKKTALVKSRAKLEYYTNLFETDDRADSQPDPTALTYFNLKEVAEKKFDVQYRSREDISGASFSEAVQMYGERFGAVKQHRHLSDVELAALAGEASPGMSIDQMLERYKEICTGQWDDLPEVVRKTKWNRYETPVREFKEAVGDLDVLNIPPSEASKYAIALQERVMKGELAISTAKDKVKFLKSMARDVFARHFPKHVNPFDSIKIKLKEKEEKKRPEYTDDDARAILAYLTTSKTSDVVKSIIEIGMFTGANAKEIIFTPPEDYVLDAPIPFIRIAPNDLRADIIGVDSLKTKGRKREVPLIGRALHAARRHPNGFPEYAYPRGEDTFSQTANKVLKKAVSGKTFAGLRHRVIDNLRDSAGVEDSVVKSIVGHSGDITAHYGRGHTLKTKLEALMKATPADFLK